VIKLTAKQPGTSGAKARVCVGSDGTAEAVPLPKLFVRRLLRTHTENHEAATER